MKNVIYAIAMIACAIMNAQTASSILGTWSFDKIDEAALTTEEAKAALPMLSNIFGTFQITFEKDLYTVNMMGDEESGAYTFVNKVVKLRDEATITFENDGTGKFAVGNASFFIKRGAYVKPVITYNYLKEDAYLNVSFDTNLLAKKWKVKEAKPVLNDPEGEITVMMLQMMGYEFKLDGTFNLTIMGVGQPSNWKITQTLGQIETELVEETSLFNIKELTADHLIMELENGALMYLVPDIE